MDSGREDRLDAVVRINGKTEKMCEVKELMVVVFLVVLVEGFTTGSRKVVWS